MVKPKNLIISFIALTFMLPLSFWYFQLFSSTSYAQSVLYGNYFLVGGLIGFLFTVLYLIIKG